MNTESTNPFHILALSGGGFKGLFTAVILEKLEEDFGFPIANKFDLLAGTSIGGIIALALAAEIPTNKIKELFINNKEKIFNKPHLFKGLAFKAKYSNEGLKECLTNIFQDKKIRDLNHKIIIPTINYTKGSTQIFKTRHHSTFKYDFKLPLVEVALATSAAPIYFPIFQAKYGDFIDGGIVANHPGLFACIEAQKYIETNQKDIFQLHIGTTFHKTTSSGKRNVRKNGFFSWRQKLFDLLFSCQEQSTEQILSFLLEERYCSINSFSDCNQNISLSLDDISETAEKLLTQKAHEAFKQFQGNKYYETIHSHNAENFIPIPLNGG